MKSIYLIVIVAILAIAVTADNPKSPTYGDVNTEWTNFKTKFGKTYHDDAEEKHRFEIFKGTYDEVTSHNVEYDAGRSTFTKRLTEFSDLTTDEFRAARGGVILPH